MPLHGTVEKRLARALQVLEPLADDSEPVRLLVKDIREGMLAWAVDGTLSMT